MSPKPRPRTDAGERSHVDHSATSINARTPRLVPAVERAVQLIDLLANNDSRLSFSDLTRQLLLPKSSVHGLLTTLTSLGIAQRAEDGSYGLGPRVMQWAGRYASQSAVINAFQALAPDIEALHRETIMLAVLDGSDVVYLACQQGSSPLAVNFRVGGRLPAHCASTGKAILATLPAPAVARLLPSAGLRQLTPHSAATLQALTPDLTRTRERGYAVDDEETAVGMYCFGAPVFTAAQPDAIAAVAVSLIKATLTPERSSLISEAICQLAREMSLRLGSESPSLG